MTDFFSITLSLLAGILLGAFFFGGLWWTVQKALTARNPALWFLGSMLLRAGVALTGFYYVGGGQWQRLAACLVGFIVARFLVMRITRSPAQKEATHAHDS